MAFKFFKKNKTEASPSTTTEKPTDPVNTEQPDDAHTVDGDSTDGPDRKGFYQRLRSGLFKTRQILTTDVDQLFSAGRALDDDLLEDLEELLVTADIGIQPATELIEALSKEKHKATDSQQVKALIKQNLLTYFDLDQPVEIVPFAQPHIIMVVGVNGVGKTTTIGKLAARHREAGRKVLLVAADTFRAAAIDQLTRWAEKTQVDLVRHKENSDPAAVVFDGIEAARARGVEVVLIDTAGRLHTQVNLMEELKKIKRTIAKKMPDAPHETLLVLDATTGQNALSQARMFSESVGVNGLALTKLDGSAKGGMVVNLCRTQQIPLRYIGVGEQIQDLQLFDPVSFVDALL